METHETMRAPADRPRNPWVVAAAWFLVLAGLAGAFYQTFASTWLRWFPAWTNPRISFYDRLVTGESYYTHGPLVPLVSLFIVLMLIRQTRVPVRPSPRLGFLVTALCLLLHLVACLARVNFASGFAFVGVLVGLVLVFWGREALRRFWFPLALLLFMVPLPEVTIASVNFTLKMLATQIGVGIVDATGIVVVRDGNRVLLEGSKTLVVANVCNGLRTLISLIGFGALYAYVCKVRGVWRPILFVMSIPVAVVSNSLRVVALILVAHFVNVETATGWFHDLSGLLIFAFAFMLMFGIERLILWIHPRPVLPLFHDVLRTEADRGQVGRMARAADSRRGWATAVVLLAAFGLTLWLSRTVPSMWTGQTVAKALPEQMTVDGLVWQSYRMTLPEQDLVILETQDYLYRRFIRPGLQSVDFCVIFSEDNRKGIHPPDLCLEGSGQGIVHKGSVSLEGVPGRGAIPCREILVQTGGQQQYFLYVYKCGGSYTDSFWVQQGTIFWNGLWRRNSSGALIRLSTMADDGLDKARERMKSFLRQAVPLLDRALP